jgi:hypothetical protein
VLVALYAGDAGVRKRMMDLLKQLEGALRDVEAAKVAVGNDLDKGGSLAFAYTRIIDAEKKLKDAIRDCKR